MWTTLIIVCYSGGSKNLAPAARPGMRILMDARPRSLIHRCSSAGYFVPVSSLRCALSERTMTSRAIRSRCFEPPIKLILSEV